MGYALLFYNICNYFTRQWLNICNFSLCFHNSHPFDIPKIKKRPLSKQRLCIDREIVIEWTLDLFTLLLKQYIMTIFVYHLKLNKRFNLNDKHSCSTIFKFYSSVNLRIGII